MDQINQLMQGVCPRYREGWIRQCCLYQCALEGDYFVLNLSFKGKLGLKQGKGLVDPVHEGGVLSARQCRISHGLSARKYVLQYGRLRVRSRRKIADDFIDGEGFL